MTRINLPRKFLRRLPACFAALVPLALIVNVPPATAQLAQQKAQIVSGIDKAVEALDAVPRLKELSPQAKRQLVEFVTGNTLFVVAHELGHGLINEMHIPVVGREEDAANSFAIVTALNMGSRFSERVLMEATKGMGSLQQTRQEGRERAHIPWRAQPQSAARLQHCLFHGRVRP